MKKTILLLLSLVLLIVCTNSHATETDDLKKIKTSIKEAAAEFETAKKDNDLKKLAEIAKTLYQNHQHIKRLLNGSEPITLLCNDKECKDPTLQIGDKISMIFNLSFDTSQEYVKSKLIWQVQLEKKIIKKGDKEIYEKGGSKKFAKEITIDDSFKNGKYRIAMHHKSDSGTTKGEVFFTIKRPITVKEIVVSTDKAAKASDDAIYSDEDIYILSGFKLDNPNEKITIDVKLIDSTKQKNLIETSFVRPKKDNTDKDQKLRFRIPASKLYKKQILDFEMKLYADDINPIIKKVIIPVKSFKLIVDAPSTLRAGRSGRYKINIPKKFVEPFKVDITPRGGILLSHTTQLSGTVEAINKGNERGFININVIDAEGRTVSSSISIALTVKEKKYIPPAVVATSQPKQNSVTPPRYGETRVRKVGKITYYEKYDGSNWAMYKSIKYHANGQKNYERSNPGSNGKPTSIKTWWKSGNVNFIGEFSESGSEMNGIFYYDNGQVAMKYHIQGSNKLKGLLKTTKENKIIDACIYSYRNTCEFVKYRKNGTTSLYGKKNSEWISIHYMGDGSISTKTIREPGSREKTGYYSNGNISYIDKYVSDKKIQYKSYWKNGKLRTQKDYWYSTGKIRENTSYDESGKKLYTLEYNENGDRR